MRYLNVEVALGIVALGLVASMAVGIPLPPAWFVVVPLTTWAVYTLDRILDARRPAAAPNTGRHLFHARHRRPLLVAVGVALAVASGTAVAFFPLEYWVVAVVLAVFTGLHLVLQRTSTRIAAVVKDLNVVFTYTASAWAISLVDGALEASLLASVSVWLPVLAVTVLLVLIDVLLLSRIDAQEDAGAGRPSIAVALGTPGLRLLNSILSLCVVVTCLVWIAPHLPMLAWTLLCMTVCYAVLERRNFSAPDKARLALEWILVAPLVLLFA